MNSAHRLCVLLVLLLSSSAFAATITVTSTDDTLVPNDAKVTLREAITAINAGNDLGDPDITAQAPGVFGTDDTIHFNIAGSGVHIIAPTTFLPNITKTVFINGYSQPGSSPNTNALNQGINAVLRIEITEPYPHLNIYASGTIIRGLVFNTYSGAILVSSNSVSANDVLIAGNFIGTDATGTSVFPPGTPGASGGVCIGVDQGNHMDYTRNTVIGGPAAADRNLISGCGLGGVAFPGFDLGGQPIGSGFVVQGNYIGTDVTGTLPLGYETGVNHALNALIKDNLISGNPDGGVTLYDNNIVQGNLIGTQRDGVSPLPNGNFGGIDIEGGGSLIGGIAAGEGNIIAFNLNDGVLVENHSFGNSITGNAIHSNENIGIALNSGHLLPNDTGDVDDVLGNHGQNYPVITSAVVSGGNATVAGTLNSIASSPFTIEFFANPACDASGYGEGKTYLGTTTVTTDASGNASFGPLNFTVPAGQAVITSTATDAAGNTSEFSQCLIAGGGASTTTTALTSSLNPSMAGQSVTFTATIVGGTSPTGSVQFKDGALNLGTAVTLSGTTATFTTSALSLGTHPITAVYSGDPGNTGSTSPVLNQVVNGAPPATTTTTLVSSLNPSFLGQAVTFTAHVTGASPTGTVQFNDGATVLANAALSGGAAVFTTSTLALGAHPITAAYAGDAANAASTSPVLTQVVNAVGGSSPPAEPIPTLSLWSLLLLLLALGGFAVHRRQAETLNR